jgi:hypothetical protein
MAKMLQRFIEEARKLKGQLEEPIVLKDEPPEDYPPLSDCSPLRRS